MYQAFTTPLPTSFIFWNPIIALVPRILIAIIAYYVYVFFRNKIHKQSISIGIAAICATLTNTIGVLGLTYLIYVDKYSAAIGINRAVAGATIA